jgi:hypothetical protein
MCPSHAFGSEDIPFGADELALGPIRSISRSDPIRRAGGTLRISPKNSGRASSRAHYGHAAAASTLSIKI